jgi:hypothetical protein
MTTWRLLAKCPVYWAVLPVLLLLLDSSSGERVSSLEPTLAPMTVYRGSEKARTRMVKPESRPFAFSLLVLTVLWKDV